MWLGRSSRICRSTSYWRSWRISLWAIVRDWPVFDRRTLGQQLLRAADSVGANIAEGSGRGSYIDNRRFVRIARGSLYEVKHWLRRAYHRDLLTTNQVEDLKRILDELAPRLNAYLKSIGRHPEQKITPIPNLPPTNN